MAPVPANKLPQIVAALTGCIGGFALGNVLGWSSPAGKLLQSQLHISEWDVAWISSIMTLGAAFSVLPLPFLMDKIGRKYTMMIIGLSLTLSWMLLAFAKNVGLLIFSRFICGFFSGSFCVVSPVYTAEVVESSIRGALGSCFQLFIVIGIFFTFALGLCENLKAIAITCAVFPIIMSIILVFLPESPVFLIASGKDDEKITAAYKALRGSEYDASTERTSLEKEIVESEARKAEGVWIKFKTKSCKKAFAICILLMVAQQMSGINVAMFYAEKVFSISGTTITPKVSGVIMGLGQVFGTLLAVFTVDRYGRKILLQISFLGMALCLGFLGLYLYLSKVAPTFVSSLGILPVILVTLYVITFSIGAGPLPWSILGEMFSPEVKSVAGSICACSNWTLAFLVTITFSAMAKIFKDFGAFWFYAVLCVVSIIMIRIFVLETRNKTLQEIQTDLEG